MLCEKRKRFRTLSVLEMKRAGAGVGTKHLKQRPNFQKTKCVKTPKVSPNGKNT